MSEKDNTNKTEPVEETVKDKGTCEFGDLVDSTGHFLKSIFPYARTLIKRLSKKSDSVVDVDNEKKDNN